MTGMLVSAAKSLLITFLSKKVLINVTIEILKWLVKQTDNDLDDEVVRIFEEGIKGKG